jgi:hypothetical protein
MSETGVKSVPVLIVTLFYLFSTKKALFDITTTAVSIHSPGRLIHLIFITWWFSFQEKQLLMHGSAEVVLSHSSVDYLVLLP